MEIKFFCYCGMRGGDGGGGGGGGGGGARPERILLMICLHGESSFLMKAYSNMSYIITWWKFIFKNILGSL